MDKIYTQHILLGVKRVTLVIIFGLFVSVLQAYEPQPFITGDIGIQAKTIKCYPNPAVSFVNFEFPADLVSRNYSLNIYSFMGKKMYETNITSVKITLTFTNEFYRGIYVYQLHDKTGKLIDTGKFQVIK